MRILFIGCISISRKMLNVLLDNGEDICGIICIPEKFQKSTSGYDDLSDIAEQYSIPIFKSRRLHKNGCSEFIKKLKPDLMVVYGWQRIIKKEILDIPIHHSIGFHASLLPKYRGSAPVNWAMINGETETGVTMFELDEDIDTGFICGQKSFPIEFDDTCATIYNKSAKAACELILEKLPEWKMGIFLPLINDSDIHPIMPRRRPEDGLIDWDKTALDNYNWIRALTKPYPGAFTETKFGRIYLWESKIQKKKTLNITGFLFTEDGLIFNCSDKDLLVTNYELVL